MNTATELTAVETREIVRRMAPEFSELAQQYDELKDRYLMMHGKSLKVRRLPRPRA